jgi:hypothetical protein
MVPGDDTATEDILTLCLDMQSFPVGSFKACGEQQHASCKFSAGKSHCESCCGRYATVGGLLVGVYIYKLLYQAVVTGFASRFNNSVRPLSSYVLCVVAGGHDGLQVLARSRCHFVEGFQQPSLGFAAV